MRVYTILPPAPEAPQSVLRVRTAESPSPAWASLLGTAAGEERATVPPPRRGRP